MADGKLNIVVDYGADNTGVIPCTDAIQNAIDDVHGTNPTKQGRAIYFPPGRYLVELGSGLNPQLLIPAGGRVTMQGAGREQTILVMDPTTTTTAIAIRILTRAELTLRDLTIDEEYPNALVSVGIALHVIENIGDPIATAPVVIILDEVRIHADKAMKFHSPYLVRATGSSFESVSRSTVQFRDEYPSLPAGAASFERCDFSAPETTNNTHCIYADPGVSMILRECRFIAGAYGLHILPTDAFFRGADHIVVDGCTFHVRKGIHSAELSPTMVSNCTFLTSTVGLQVNGPLIVTNCIFLGEAIANYNNSSDYPIVVSNCDFRGQSEFTIHRYPKVIESQQSQPWSFSHCRFENTAEASNAATIRMDTGLIILRSCDFRAGPPLGSHLRAVSGEVILDGCTVADRPLWLLPSASDGAATGTVRATLVACRFLGATALYINCGSANSLTLDGRDNGFQPGPDVITYDSPNGAINFAGALVPRPGRGADLASSSPIALPLSENQVRITGNTTITNMWPGASTWKVVTCQAFQGPWYLIGLQEGQIVKGAAGQGAFASVRLTGTVPGEARAFILVQNPPGTFQWHEL